MHEYELWRVVVDYDTADSCQSTPTPTPCIGLTPTATVITFLDSRKYLLFSLEREI
jgi:hypothetical protein